MEGAMISESTKNSDVGPGGDVAGTLNVTIPPPAGNRRYTKFSGEGVIIDYDPVAQELGFTIDANAAVDGSDPALTTVYLHLPKGPVTATNRIVTLRFVSQTWELQEGRDVRIDYDARQEVTVRVTNKDGVHGGGYRLEMDSRITAIDRK
jgi:hypothetical protein